MCEISENNHNVYFVSQSKLEIPDFFQEINPLVCQALINKLHLCHLPSYSY